MSRRQALECTLAASLATTVLIAWLSGVDVVGLFTNLAAQLGETLLTGLRHPIVLPLGAVLLLVMPSVWLIGRALLAVGSRLRRRLRARRGAAVAPEGAAASEPARDALTTGADAQIAYAEDALFGVVWRWRDDPSESSVEAHCPACDAELVPHAQGGSLSRGLRCERCNKLRAAGEHPGELREKIIQALESQALSGDWRNAPLRVDKVRAAARRELATFALAGPPS